MAARNLFQKLWDQQLLYEITSPQAFDGSEVADFVLDRSPYRRASVLVALTKFGCGSSQQHAVWAPADFGLRVIIAPGFASIFYGNCVKSGVLPVTLQEDRVEDLLALLDRDLVKTVAVDLQLRQVVFPDGSMHPFDISEAWRETLLQGLDPVTVAASHEEEIAAYQRRDCVSRPWIWQRRADVAEKFP